MKISQSKIDEIAASIDIVDVISPYTNLRKAGKNFMGRCPFHEERTPSFSVSQEKGVYHCFGCGKSGNIFTFIMDIDNVSFYDAVKTLAERAGIQLQFDEEQYEDRNKIELLYEINKRAGKYFYDNLMSNEGVYAKEYLEHRGIKNETITKFGLGFSLRANDALLNKFQSEFKKEDLLESGLFVETNRREARDRFRGRIMFPIFSESNKVIGFGARKLFNEDYIQGKYINSPNTKIYNKSSALYGLNFTKTEIRDQDFVIIVEGYMDFISLFQSNVKNVVASCGTSITDQQLKKLLRFTNKSIIFLDSDIAGIKSARDKIKIILRNRFNVRFITLPIGEDPDSYLKKYGTNSLIEKINNSESFLAFLDYAEKFEKGIKTNTPEYLTYIVKEGLDLISSVKDYTNRLVHLKDLANKYNIDEYSFRNIYLKYLKNENELTNREIQSIANEIAKKRGYVDKINKFEIILVKLIAMSDFETKKYIMDNLEVDYITDTGILELVNYFFKNYDKLDKIDYLKLFNEFNDERLRDIIGKALLENKHDYDEKDRVTDFKKDAKLIITQLKIADLKRKIQNLENKIKSANQYSPETTILQKEHQVLTKERVALEKEMRGK